MWMVIGVMSTINGHSGYSFPFSPFDYPNNHDVHHATFINNYGSIGLLDRLHGTKEVC